MSSERVGDLSVATDEAFAALLCDDPELLDAEFEEIMTANGFVAEPPEPSRPVKGPAGSDDWSWVKCHRCWWPSPGVVVVRMRRRQRSPP